MSTNDRGTEKRIVASADSRTLKRAQWEAFEFEVEGPGRVRVINGSYGDEADEHTYTVTLEGGAPTECECKAFEFGDGPCKHLVALAIREPIMQAAQATETAEPAMTDGGQATDPDACRHGQTGCCGPDGGELPCFECYREAAR